MSCIYLLILLHTLSLWIGKGSSCPQCSFETEFLKPETLVLENKTISLICAHENNGCPSQSFVLLLTLKGVGTHRVETNPKLDEQFHNRSVYWNYTNNSILMYNVTITASKENNGTILLCSNDNVDHCTTTTTLVVVTGPPPMPSPPLVEILNSSAANISWKSQWSHPVNNYTLTISDINATLFTNTTVTTNSIIITKDSINDCTLLSVTVTANTDVGSSKISNSTAFGFPKSFDTTAANISLTKFRCGQSLSYQVVIQKPLVCDYDTLIYDYIIRDLSSNGLILVNNNSMLEYQLFSLTSATSVNVSVHVTNNVNQTIYLWRVYDTRNISEVFANTTGTIVQPKEAVALNNSIVTFTCSAYNDLAEKPTITLNHVENMFLDDISEYTGITWNAVNTSGNGIKYQIFMNTSLLITNTINFDCGLQRSCIGSGVLYVVERPPPKQSPPLVEVLNSSAVNISWESPWEYPVNNYTLNISNINTTLFTNTTVTTNSIIITKDNIDDCTLLSVTVAANTDIDSNEASDSKIFGFPKSLELIETSEINKSINTTYGNQIMINIEVIIPDVCSYDNLTYLFSVINESNNQPIKQQSSNTPNIVLNLDSSSSIEHDSFNITVMVTSTNGKFKEERLFVLYTNYNISIPRMSSSSSVLLITTTSSPASTPTSPSFPTIAYIAIGIFAGLIIIPSVIIIILLIACLRQKKKNTIRSRPNLQVTEDRIDFTMPKMEFNPTYVTPLEPQYESVMNIRGLHVNQQQQHQLIHDSVPNIPVPTLPVAAASPSPTPPTLPPPRSSPSNISPCQSRQEREDEYIEMSSRSNNQTCSVPPSPRYIKAPGSTSPLPPERLDIVQENIVSNYTNDNGVVTYSMTIVNPSFYDNGYRHATDV